MWTVFTAMPDLHCRHISLWICGRIAYIQYSSSHGRYDIGSIFFAQARLKLHEKTSLSAWKLMACRSVVTTCVRPCTARLLLVEKLEVNLILTETRVLRLICAADKMGSLFIYMWWAQKNAWNRKHNGRSRSFNVIDFGTNPDLCKIQSFQAVRWWSNGDASILRFALMQYQNVTDGRTDRFQDNITALPIPALAVA